MSNSNPVISNQDGMHPRLEVCVKRHLSSPFQKPVADHTRHAFDAVQDVVARSNRPLIFDSCCGVGESSRHLAKIYPDHLVIAVDKSVSRLSREGYGDVAENLLLVRADLNDFYRLAQDANWRLDRHFILYPNPWPKAEHLKRRWHGAPVFPSMVALGGIMEVRSNWKTYLDEFQLALQLMGYEARCERFEADCPITPFERKYKASGQDLWRLAGDVGAHLNR